MHRPSGPGPGGRRLLLLALLALAGLAAAGGEAWGPEQEEEEGEASGGGGSGRKVSGGDQDEASFAYANVALGKHATLSSTKCPAAAAVDGYTVGVQGDCGTAAVSGPELSPRLEVLLGREHALQLVEVWAPLRGCDLFRKDKKSMVQCKEVEQVNGVTPRTPLVVALLGAGGKVLAKRAFRRPRGVYVWGEPGGWGGVAGVRVTLPGRSHGRVLEVAEVRAMASAQGRACGLETCFRGRCTGGGRCACEPDWAGPDCSTLTRAAWRHLPPPAPRSPLPPPAALWWDGGLADAYADGERGREGQCPADPVRYLPGPRGKGAGLGSSLFYLTGEMTAAARRGDAFVFGGRLNYAESGACEGRGVRGGLECYFRPSGGRCPPRRDEWVEPAPNPRGAGGSLALARRKKKGGRGRGGEAGKEQSHTCTLGDKCDDMALLDLLPEPHDAKGYLWYRALQVGRLLRLNRATQSLLGLEALKESIGYQHPVIGLHVRRGDSCHTTRRKGRCRGFSSYLPEVLTLAERYNIRRVFIATDDASVVDEARSGGSPGRPPPSLEFLAVPAEARRGTDFDSGTKIEVRLADRESGLDPHRLMLSTLTDLMLLAESDALIGHMASTMSRIALLLAAGRLRELPPYISMDGPFCHHWRMCCDVDARTGESTPC